MSYFLQLSCFAFMFGIYLAVDDLYMFLPHQPAPIPKCPENEVFKFCLSNCSNCDQRGFCVLQHCRENGCDCLPHFVRLEPDGPCVPVSKCPIPECDEHEVFRECGPICEKCSTFNCRMVHCEHRCYCEEGYKRNSDGKCIPQNDCPTKQRCAREEEWRDSGPEDEYCLHEPGEAVSEAILNVTKCYCREGFKRNGLGHCIDKKYCPIVKCVGIETYQSCPRKCNVTCRTYGDPDCVEDGQCYPGCFCPEGFLMNDFRMCVPLENCPQGSNPYVPTTPAPEETTTSTSVDEDDEANNGTTSTTDTETDDELEKDAEIIAAAESDGSELPDNLPDEDIPSDDEAEVSTTESEEKDEERK